MTNLTAPTIVLGAGLSGLAAALTLHRRNQPVLVLEQSHQVGGRVRTRVTPEGFRIDQGFQVLLESYPELTRFIDLDDLDLKPFASGARIYNGRGLSTLANPLSHPLAGLGSLFSSSVTPGDLLRMIPLAAKALGVREDSPMGQPTTLEFLRAKGFSERFIDEFWTPFFTGVYLDPKLTPGSQFFLFLLRSFATGRATLPAKGMQAFPEAMAKQLPSSAIRLGARVQSFTANEVTLTTGEVLKAKNVICAFDTDPTHEYNTVTSYYFSGTDLNQLDWGRWLILVPTRFQFKTNNVALLTAVSSDYGPKPMLSASVIAATPSPPPSVIKTELETIADRRLDLQLVDQVTVTRALPKTIEPGPGFASKDGVLYCGDRWTSPSINGALRSGRLAAESLS